MVGSSQARYPSSLHPVPPFTSRSVKQSGLDLGNPAGDWHLAPLMSVPHLLLQGRGNTSHDDNDRQKSSGSWFLISLSKCSHTLLPGPPSVIRMLAHAASAQKLDTCLC